MISLFLLFLLGSDYIYRTLCLIICMDLFLPFERIPYEYTLFSILLFLILSFSHLHLLSICTRRLLFSVQMIIFFISIYYKTISSKCKTISSKCKINYLKIPKKFLALVNATYAIRISSSRALLFFNIS